MPKALTYRRPGDGRGGYAGWLLSLKGKSGAYVIRALDGKSTLYVGESHTGRLYSTIIRHFATWNDAPERKHHTYDKNRVEVEVRLTPPTSAAGAQNNLIGRLNPRDNGNGWPDWST